MSPPLDPSHPKVGGRYEDKRKIVYHVVCELVKDFFPLVLTLCHALANLWSGLPFLYFTCWTFVRNGAS